MLESIVNHETLIVLQRRELAELIGFETRNKYEIQTADGKTFCYCAEQQRGLLGILFRQIIGHWRRFDLHFFSPDRNLLFIGRHPFRWFFQRLELDRPDGQRLGAIQQRFGIFTKIFDFEDAHGRTVLRMESGFLSFWTFPIYRQGREVARIEKKWSGLLKEVFTDTDNFRLSLSKELGTDERWLVLAASVFADLQYFERKAGN